MYPNCLLCGVENGHNDHPHGTEFTASGNYGSGLFDMEPGSLVIVICDNCLSRNSDRVVHERVETERTVFRKVWSGE